MLFFKAQPTGPKSYRPLTPVKSEQGKHVLGPVTEQMKARRHGTWIPVSLHILPRSMFKSTFESLIPRAFPPLADRGKIKKLLLVYFFHIKDFK